MKLVDANFLLYAVDEDSPHHEVAKPWLEHGAELCSGDADFGRFAGLQWTNPLPGRNAA